MNNQVRHYRQINDISTIKRYAFYDLNKLFFLQKQVGRKITMTDVLFRKMNSFFSIKNTLFVNNEVREMSVIGDSLLCELHICNGAGRNIKNE